MNKSMNLEIGPIAEKRDHWIEAHGFKWNDPYFWMREKEDPSVIRHLEKENDFFQRSMKPFQKLKKEVFSELRSRLSEDDQSAPLPWGKYEYFQRSKKGKQHPIQCRRLIGSKKEEVILDWNTLAKGQAYFHTYGTSISPLQNRFAFSFDLDGSEKYKIQFKGIGNKEHFSEILTDCSGSLIWSNDNKTVYYSVVDKLLRPYRVYRHILGEDPSSDELVYEETDPRYFVRIRKSNSGDYFFFSSVGQVTSETSYLKDIHPDSNSEDQEREASKVQVLVPRQEGVHYSVTDWQRWLLVLTDFKAPNFRVLKMDAQILDRRSKINFSKMEELIPESKEETLFSLHSLQEYLLIEGRKNGLPFIEILNAKGKRKQMRFQDPVFHVQVIPGLDYNSSTTQLRYSSPVQPSSTLEYSLKTHKIKVLKEQKIKSYRKSKYLCERKWVRSHDGVKVPIIILRKKGVNKKAPALLYGYGSYGHSLPAAFSTNIFSLVDRGFVYVLAQIRGGQEMGRKWYEDGKFLKKKNTFLDFIACAEWLKKSGLVHPRKLAIKGGSAGGMLMGACMNMRPDLFDVVCAHVPFVDVLNTMMDPSLPLTPTEYKEWGNPDDKRYFRYIRSYSPYDNIERRDYPRLFVTAGLNDPRVTYWEPAKWVARLREMKTDSHPILFKINMGAGHFGQSGRYEVLKEVAEEYAYILSQIGGKR